MKIAFFCESGEIMEIGTGHKYRTLALAEELRRRGHQVVDKMEDAEILVIDHLMAQTDLIKQAKSLGRKVVLIDGTAEDTLLADVAISAFYNKAADFSGIEYMAFPVRFDVEPYNVDIDSNKIFVGVGGFDANNRAELAIKVIGKLGYNALVAKSINHPDFSQTYPHVTMFEGKDYYEALSQCIVGITAGGLTLFQALQFGLPCLAMPQYDHQMENIEHVSHCCMGIFPYEYEMSYKLNILLGKAHRENLSRIARRYVDGKGVQRICDVIEGVLC